VWLGGGERDLGAERAGKGGRARGRNWSGGEKHLVIPPVHRDPAAEAAVELAGYGRERLDSAGDEGRLHLADGVVDGDAIAFVEDLDAEDLAGGSAALFVGGGQGDVEGQDLVGVPGGGQFLVAGD
jgi:hypothetical protein